MKNLLKTIQIILKLLSVITLAAYFILMACNIVVEALFRIGIFSLLLSCILYILKTIIQKNKR